MVGIIALLVLTAALLILLAAEAVIGIRCLIKRHTGTLASKQCIRFKRNSLLLVITAALTGGYILFSQFAASTPPIKDENGRVIEGSIAELKQVNLNGRKEWISIRGENSDNPVLLFLAGGPGGTQMSAVRLELSQLEKHFVVVVWDQPGSGKSYSAGGKNLTVDTYIEDGLALTEYLRQRFGQEKIYLVGESWGSALGMFLASESPGSYYAMIGTGQMVDFVETENMDYDKAIEIAEGKGDTEKIEKLRKNGRPPYYGSDVTWKSNEYLNYLYIYMARNPEIHNSGLNTFDYIFTSEYGLMDKINYLRGIVSTFNHVYPQLYGTDLRKDYSRLEVPVYFFLGRHDINAPTSLTEDYYTVLEAPHKEIIWFEHSGHSPWISESDKFVSELLSIVE